jgi:rare lipoprotein A
MMMITAFLAAAGCEGRQADEQAAAGGSDGDPLALSDAMLNRLVAEYPSLGEERAPAPQPSADADPANMPERFRDRLPDAVLETMTGEATFYADHFEGRRTASGIPFRQNQMVAAHRAFPFVTILQVTNLRNDRSVNVRVVDRGPFGASAERRGTMLDLSRRAATHLDFIGAGRAPIRIEVLEWGQGLRGVS